MTAAFDTFMNQYRMIGSDKADGYGRNAFIGLSEVEKASVFQLLVGELPFSAEWLFLVDPIKAFEVAKNEETKMRGDPYSDTYMLQEWIVQSTGNMEYQAHMIDDYPIYRDSVKPLVVDSIGRTPQNENTIEFFKRIVLTEVNNSSVARAARNLLSAKQIPRGTEEQKLSYRRLFQALTSESIAVRSRALSEIS